MNWPTTGFTELDKFYFSPTVVPPDGTGSSGILLVGEAPGYHEDTDRIPFHPHADAGSVLSRCLRRASLTRETLKLTNCVWQRPPENELAWQPYEQLAIDLWKPFNKQLVEEMRPKVVMLLGNTALKTFTEFGHGVDENDKTSIMHLQNYAFSREGIIYLPVIHPSFILHGKQEYNGVLVWALGQAQRLARSGIMNQPARYIEYPSEDQMLAFERNFNPSIHWLSYDIETPESDKLTEEEVEEGISDISYQIIRMSLCYDAENGYAISFPWRDPFIPIAKRMMATSGRKRVWNGPFDNPRLRHAGVEIGGQVHDVMDCWHFVQPTLPRSLEFATPLLGWQNGPWKIYNQAKPEFYSCVDAHTLQYNGDQLEKSLKSSNRWGLYERHVVKTYEILTRMSKNGLPYDKERAKIFEAKLTVMKAEREVTLQARVPDELKTNKQVCGYKKVPPFMKEYLDTNQAAVTFQRIELEMEEDEETGEEKESEVLAKYEFRHFRLTLVDKTLPSGKVKAEEKRAKIDTPPDKVFEVDRWARIKDFMPTSSQQLIKLIKFNGFQPGTHRKTKRDTSDIETIRKILKKCLNSKRPADKEFAITLKLCREVKQLSKVLGTYVKGWTPGPDGRIHSSPGFWGKMMRISWRRPNIAATIADKSEEYIAAGFRECVAASPGKKLVEADWKGIEGVIVGYFAGDKDYMRLAKIGVHDYFCSHILASKGKISKSEIPSLALSDAELKPIFKSLKKRFPKDRDDAKHVVHGQNYGMGPALLADMYEMPLAEAERLQAMYFDLFPKIKAWQDQVVARADRECRLVNPFNYQMPFWEVRRLDSKFAERLRVSWKKYENKSDLTWFEKEHIRKIMAEVTRAKVPVGQVIENLSWKRGDDAKSAISFLPRDSAAAMLKEALLRIDPQCKPGQLLSSTHDSILMEVYDEEVDWAAKLLFTEMIKPVPELGNLVVDVDVAVGQMWVKEGENGMESIEINPLWRGQN